MVEGKKKGQVFIRGLTADANEKDLELAFSKFGPVDEVVIPKDRETRVPKGFAFLTFLSADDCADAIKGMDGKEINGVPISVEEASERRNDRDRRMDRGRGRGRGGFYRDSGRGFSRDGGFRGRGRGGSRDFIPRGGRGGFRGGRGSPRGGSGGFRDSSRMRFESRDFDSRGPPRERSRDMDRGPRDSFGGSGRDFGYSNGFKSFASREPGREYGERGDRYGSSRGEFDTYSSRGYDALSSRDLFGSDRYGSSRSSGYDRDGFGGSSAMRYSKSSPLRDYGEDRFSSLGSRYDEPPRSLSSRYESLPSASRYEEPRSPISRDYGGRDSMYESYSSSRGFEGGSRGSSDRGFGRGPPRDDRPRDDRRERRMPRDLDDGPPMKRPRSDGIPMRGSRGMGRGRGSFHGGPPRGASRH